MGGRPILTLAVVGMPIDKLTPAVIARVLEGGQAVCAAAGAPMAGGHSIDSVEPIYGVVALGLVHPDRIKRNSTAQAGDVLILGKPLGIGVFSAALKKGLLSTEDYAAMLDSTTRLNTPGAELAQLDGVHAMTDVTGFGLLGHLLEVCRGSGVSADRRFDDLPFFSHVQELAAQGHTTGASTRNWASYGGEVELPADWPEVRRKLLTDPQTSGGLLVACAPEAADSVLAIFHAQGHTAARRIGSLSAGPARVRVA
jgi:selenide,water dikinase